MDTEETYEYIIELLKASFALTVPEVAERIGLDEDQVRQAVSELDEMYNAGDGLYTVFE